MLIICVWCIVLTFTDFRFNGLRRRDRGIINRLLSTTIEMREFIFLIKWLFGVTPCRLAPMHLQCLRERIPFLSNFCYLVKFRPRMRDLLLLTPLRLTSDTLAKPPSVRQAIDDGPLGLIALSLYSMEISAYVTLWMCILPLFFVFITR